VTPPSSGPSQAAGVAAGVLLGGRYRLDELLASGGMAQVWLGTDEVLRRAIALKILHQHLAADETFVTRFRHEAIAVAKLSHPSIVNVYDTCSDDGVEAIVMELVRGQTLRQRLDDGALDPWVAANIAAQVAGALAVAHAAGLVHRDIKPANILLSQDGRVKVGDFGIAKAAESADLTQEGSFLGTAKYLAPEQVEGNPVDGRTDLYSLGVVLYEMLCGRVPFEADTASATALARLHNDPQRPRLVRAGVPRELEDHHHAAAGPRSCVPLPHGHRRPSRAAGGRRRRPRRCGRQHGCPSRCPHLLPRRRCRARSRAARRRAVRRSASATASGAGSSPRSWWCWWRCRWAWPGC
jgi:serine/threonine-protein kinase